MTPWLPPTSAITRLLRLGLITMAASGAAHAASNGGAPTTGVRAIENAYHRLLRELDLSRRERLDETVRHRIAEAAREMQDAIKRDGGARRDLDSDARNIALSLADGTFNAGASIEVLRRDVKGSVIDAGAWTPSLLEGSPIPDSIGPHLSQTNEGDCVGVSIVRAFSTTLVGSNILHKAVTRNADGSYNVNLPGDPQTVHHLAVDELKQFGKGDPAAAAVVGAMYRYFHLDPTKAALPTNKVMELLAGRAGDHARLADADTTPQGIVNFLVSKADGVGSRVAMVFGGRPRRDGAWSKGDGHAFAVIRIDAASGLLTYTNPWNQETIRTIALVDLAREAAGTSADFEIVSFH